MVAALHVSLFYHRSSVSVCLKTLQEARTTQSIISAEGLNARDVRNLHEAPRPAGASAVIAGSNIRQRIEKFTVAPVVYSTALLNYVHVHQSPTICHTVICNCFLDRSGASNRYHVE